MASDGFLLLEAGRVEADAELERRKYAGRRRRKGRKEEKWYIA